MNYSQQIAEELFFEKKYVSAIIKLLEDGSTVPFIARYRKEQTGNADEVLITNISETLEKLKELNKRKGTVLKSIEEQGKLTDELRKKIEDAISLTQVEDIYLPYKVKRKTRATIAYEKGLSPLSKILLKQRSNDIETEAIQFINANLGVNTTEDALSGARDIIAEKVNEDAVVREGLRKLFWKEGLVTSKVVKSKKEDAQKYSDYFAYNEPISKVPSHRLLAIRRGEKEGFLRTSIAPDEKKANGLIERLWLRGDSLATRQVQIAIKDSYKRLLKPSIETEVRTKSKQIADKEAIEVFSENAKELLLAAPLGDKAILAIDPGFRTGCKVVCLNKQGKLLQNDTIYPTAPHNKTDEATKKLKQLVETYKIDAIAIGNGTASRETESFVRSIAFDRKPTVVIVNESGASIYSASEVAREEFPKQDVTVRGAVSIGRRLIDPLAELVKIDPKSIGVGQYQHDVDQSLLGKSLDAVVESCVNKVGVELNTASKQLLSYVSGLGETIAENIVTYRNQNGAFSSINDLKKVPKLGKKTFEQCAGFLRIKNGKNPLDESAVHPERYTLVMKIAKDIGIDVKQLIGDNKSIEKINLNNYISAEVGMHTLKDIVDELEKPGRDPREAFELFSFREGVNKISDLQIGMVMPGIITNVTKFGAFADIGVHQDGLIHISQLADTFVSDASDIVKVNQQVQVKVVDVDLDRKRIALSMKTVASRK